MRRWWLWAALGAALLLVSSQQTWVSGTWQDPVLGAILVEGTGTQVGNTLTAGALLAGAALLAGLVGSRPVRLAAGICLAGGAALAGLPALSTLLGPGEAVAAVAAERPGAASLTITVDDVTTTPWAWVGLLGAALILSAAVLCVLHWLRPTRPASVGEAFAADGATSEGATASAGRIGPADGATTEGRPRRAARPSDPWDDLTRGHDPTLGD